MRRLQQLALPVAMALAAINVLWQLGSSSLYVDEIISVGAASQPLGHVIHTVGTAEITPPGYFLLLHEWLGHVGSSDGLARLPSALFAVALVGVVYWLARLIGGGRMTGFAAAVLCALSAFELEYAQRAQGYELVALAATTAVAAAVAADRGGPHRGRWLVCSVAAAMLALLCNYTAALAIAPLCIWVMTRRSFARRWRWSFAGACVAVEVALIPLLITQHSTFPTRPGVQSVAALTPSTLLNMLEVPFGGRVNALRPLGVAVTVLALAVVVLSLAVRREVGFGPRRLTATIAIGGPLSLVTLSALGGRAFWGHLMLTRYAAVAAPFMIVMIAFAPAALPRPGGVLLAGAIAVATLAGTVENHRISSFYLDARQAAAYVQANARPGDVVLEPPYPWYRLPLEHYGLGRLHSVPATGTVVQSLIARHRQRVWLLAPPGAGETNPATVLAQARRTLAPYRYVPLRARVFPSSVPLLAVLLAPAR